MANTLKTTTANAVLDNLYDTRFGGATAIAEIRSGAPAGPDNTASGTLGASITCSGGWAAAASKSKAKSGTAWTNTAAAAITAAHYRLKNAGDTEREEGTVTLTGSGGDMTLDNTSIASGQTVTITSYTRTLP